MLVLQLNLLPGNSPKISLQRAIANMDPISAIHKGIDGGSTIARRRPVKSALKLPVVTSLLRKIIDGQCLVSLLDKGMKDGLP